MDRHRFALPCNFATVLCLAATLAHGTTAGAPATQPDAQQVDALVAQLADEASAVRERARRGLVALGEEAEPRLKEELARTTDPETQNAIEAVLAGIRSAQETGGTPVTLDLNGASFAEALDAFTRQTGIEFTAPNPPDRRLDLALRRVPMWQALLEVCGKSGMAFRAIENGRVVLEPLANAGAAAPPAATSGPFLVTLAGIEVNTTKSVLFGGPRPMNLRTNAIAAPPCRLYLFAWGEPRLKTIRWVIDAIDECATDTGEQLTTSGNGAMFSRGSGGVNGRSETQLILSGPTAAARKIARLKMSARFIVQGDLDRLELPDVLTLKDSAHELAGIPVLIRGVGKVVDNQYAYEVVVRRASKTPAEWALITSMLHQWPCKLVDADGNALQPRGSNSSQSGDEVKMTSTVTREFAGAAGKKVGEPVKLVWEFPSDLQQFPVSLEFRDVPLP